MFAAGSGDAMRQQVAPRRVRNRIVGIVEQLEVESGLGQHLGRICAEAAEHRRKSQYAADADSRFCGPTPYRSLPGTA